MMNPQAQTAPLAMIYGLVFLVLGGVVALLWGRRLPRAVDGLVGVLLLFVFGTLVYAGNGLLDEGSGAKVWIRGWIWPLDSRGALAIGLLEDPLGLIMAGLTIIFSAVLIFNWRLTSQDSRPERFISAVAFSAAGTALCWVSLTPWFCFLGLVLATFGGFVAMGSNWCTDSESRLAVRFIRQRFFGLFVSVLGACGFCGARGTLLWLQGPTNGQAEAWITSLQSMSLSESVGLFFLIFGLIIQLQPFFVLGWLVSPTRGTVWGRVALTQVLPAWASFALLLRLQNHLGAVEYFTGFGWLLLVSTAASVFSAMLQARWESALCTWLSAGVTFAAATLCFGNSAASLSLIVGLGLGVTAFAMSRAAMSSKKPSPPALKIAAYLGISAATGVIGFGSAEGWTQWLSQIWMDPVLSGAAILVFVLFVFQGWKLAWSVGPSEKAEEIASGGIQAMPLILVFLSFGILWTGTITGDVFPGAPDRLFSSLVSLMFSATFIPSVVHGAVFVDYLNVAAVGASLGAVVVAMGIAFWAAQQSPRGLAEGNDPRKRIFRFIASGYGTDLATEKLIGAFSWSSQQLNRWLDDRFWKQLFPAATAWLVRTSTRKTTAADQLLSKAMRKSLRLMVEPPAKFLQLIQSGDLQWYLVFGMGSGFALLIHFLWNSKAVMFK